MQQQQQPDPKLPNLAAKLISAFTENTPEKIEISAKWKTARKETVIVKTVIFKCEQGIPIISVKFRV